MDYYKIYRSLIYKDRNDLKDFGVQTLGTLNYYIFSKMRRMTLLRCGDAKEIALRCFNNAYYICTLTQLDEYPDLCMDKYEKLLYPNNIPFSEDVYQASMALVCVLLAAYDDKYKKKNDPLIESIHHWTSSNKWTNSTCHKSFSDIIEACCPDGFSLPSDAFAPRNIIEAIENVHVNNLIYNPDFICERISTLDDSLKRKKGIDLTIARLKDERNRLYERFGYDPETNTIKHAVYGLRATRNDINCFNEKIQPVRELITYFEQHYQSIVDTTCKGSAQREESKNMQVYETEKGKSQENQPLMSQGKESDTCINDETLQITIRDLTSENEQLTCQLNESNKKNEELTKIIDDYKAKYDPTDLKKNKVTAMTGKQHVILFLAVLAHHNRIPKTRANLSCLMTFIASRNETTMKDYLKQHITEDECNKLAKYFDDEVPFIAGIIRDLPEKLEKDKSQKNREKALKNV